MKKISINKLEIGEYYWWRIKMGVNQKDDLVKINSALEFEIIKDYTNIFGNNGAVMSISRSVDIFYEVSKLTKLFLL